MFTDEERMNVLLCYDCLCVCFHMSSQTSEIYFLILYYFLVFDVYI